MALQMVRGSAMTTCHNEAHKCTHKHKTAFIIRYALVLETVNHNNTITATTCSRRLQQQKRLTSEEKEIL